MLIRKEYDIEQLLKELADRIGDARTMHTYHVSVPLDTAVSIFDVLQETLRREEKKHQTLESAITFMEMEDGTQTNEIEEELESLSQSPCPCFGQYEDEKCEDEYGQQCIWKKSCKKCKENKEARRDIDDETWL